MDRRSFRILNSPDEGLSGSAVQYLVLNTGNICYNLTFLDGDYYYITKIGSLGGEMGAKLPMILKSIVLNRNNYGVLPVIGPKCKFRHMTYE